MCVCALECVCVLGTNVHPKWTPGWTELKSIENQSADLDKEIDMNKL